VTTRNLSTNLNHSLKLFKNNFIPEREFVPEIVAWTQIVDQNPTRFSPCTSHLYGVATAAAIPADATLFFLARISRAWPTGRGRRRDLR
jgi:hypothetical protein